MKTRDQDIKSYNYLVSLFDRCKSDSDKQIVIEEIERLADENQLFFNSHAKSEEIFLSCKPETIKRIRLLKAPGVSNYWMNEKNWDSFKTFIVKAFNKKLISGLEFQDIVLKKTKSTSKASIRSVGNEFFNDFFNLILKQGEENPDFLKKVMTRITSLDGYSSPLTRLGELFKISIKNGLLFHLINITYIEPKTKAGFVGKDLSGNNLKQLYDAPYSNDIFIFLVSLNYDHGHLTKADLKKYIDLNSNQVLSGNDGTINYTLLKDLSKNKLLSAVVDFDLPIHTVSAIEFGFNNDYFEKLKIVDGGYSYGFVTKFRPCIENYKFFDVLFKESISQIDELTRKEDFSSRIHLGQWLKKDIEVFLSNKELSPFLEDSGNKLIASWEKYDEKYKAFEISKNNEIQSRDSLESFVKERKLRESKPPEETPKEVSPGRVESKEDTLVTKAKRRKA